MANWMTDTLDHGVLDSDLNSPQNERLWSFSNKWESISDTLDMFSSEKIGVAMWEAQSIYNEVMPTFEKAKSSISKDQLVWINNFMENPRTKHIAVEDVFENANLSKEGRFLKAEEVLWRELSDGQKEWILLVHNMFPDKNVFELSQEESFRKIRTLVNKFWFTAEEATKLCDYWVCWFIWKTFSGILNLIKNNWVLASLLVYYWIGSWQAEELFYGTFNESEMWWNAWYLAVYAAIMLVYTWISSESLSWMKPSELYKTLSNNSKFIWFQSAFWSVHLFTEWLSVKNNIHYMLSDLPVTPTIIVTILTYRLLIKQTKQGAWSIADKENRN